MVGKGEYAVYQHFLLCQQCFFGGVIKTCEYAEKGLIPYHTILTFNTSGKDSFGKHCGKRRKCW